MKYLIMITLLVSSCGNETTSSAEPREITRDVETKYETRTECKWEIQCRNVRTNSRRRSKWSHPHYRRSCEKVQTCEEIIVPVSI